MPCAEALWCDGRANRHAAMVKVRSATRTAARADRSLRALQRADYGTALDRQILLGALPVAEHHERKSAEE
jgi:hypothetical protein